MSLLRAYSPVAVKQIVLRAQPWSFNDPQRILAWADLFIAAHTRTPGGLSLEIGTWKGGTALVLCELLELIYHARSRPMLFTVDPYGDKPYQGGDRPETPALFGDADYALSKSLLAPYPHHAHFMMPAMDFLEGMAGKSYWWRGVARQVRGLTFALLDGEHDAISIEQELRAVWPLLADDATVVVDNTNNDPATVDMLKFFAHASRCDLVKHEAALPGQTWAHLVKP